MSMENDVWMTTEIAARYIGLASATLRQLAKNHKIEFRSGWSPDSIDSRAKHRRKMRKLWFEKGQLDSFLSAHTVVTPDGREVRSTALQSAKILLAAKWPGHLVTVADAVAMLGCTRRAIKYLIETKRLRPLKLKLGYRTKVFTRKHILIAVRIRNSSRRPYEKKNMSRARTKTRLAA